jgi:hypothetical protein
MENKPRFHTIQEYLEKYLYPSLHLAVEGLIEFIRSTELHDDLIREFNQNFFENKAKIIQKEKEMLKLERGSDYSESDYEYFMRINMNVNESKSENKVEEIKEEFDPDFDDSEMLHLAEQELNNEEEEKEQKFNPIEYLALKLKDVNLNKKNLQDLDDVLINYTNVDKQDDNF